MKAKIIECTYGVPELPQTIGIIKRIFVPEFNLAISVVHGELTAVVDYTIGQDTKIIKEVEVPACDIKAMLNFAQQRQEIQKLKGFFGFFLNS